MPNVPRLHWHRGRLRCRIAGLEYHPGGHPADYPDRGAYERAARAEFRRLVRAAPRAPRSLRSLVTRWGSLRGSPYTLGQLQALTTWAGSQSLAHLSPDLLQDYQGHLLRLTYPRGRFTKRLAPSTVNRRVSLGLTVLRWARDRGWTRQLPTRPRGLPTGWAARPVPPELLAQILPHLGGPVARLIRFCLLTGARTDEACRATWERVEYRDSLPAVLTLPQHKTRERTGLARVVYLSRAAAQLLVETPPGCRTGRLFKSTRTGRYTYAGVRSALRRACRAAGVSPISPHQLRHTFATKARNQGLPLDILAKLLGHRSLATTQRYYSLDESVLFRALSQLTD